jgi:chloramphenicol-sensitive protein RarD
MNSRDDKRAWVTAIATYFIWGLMPLFWRVFDGTPVLVVFLYRCLWSFPFLIFLTILSDIKVKEFFVLNRGRWPWFMVSGFLIGLNWWLYIKGVDERKVVEISLGFFLAPLLTTVFGSLILGERLSSAQWFGAATCILGTMIYGRSLSTPPMLALGLSLTFCGYSLVRKFVKAPPLAALTTETSLLFAVSVFYILTTKLDASMGQAWTAHGYFLILAGVLTALPLWGFAHAVRRLHLTSLSLASYVSPLIKLLVAIFVFQEIVSDQQVLSFAVVWLGLVIFQASSHRRNVMLPQPE